MENITYRTGTEVKQVSAGPYKLNMRDVARGLLMAILSAAVVAAQQAITEPDFMTRKTLTTIGIAAMGGGIGYLMSFILSNAIHVE